MNPVATALSLAALVALAAPAPGAGLRVGNMAQGPDGGGTLDADPAAVWELVAARCAPCHDPSAPGAADEPRALREWSRATSLAEVAASVVVPGAPDESDLFLAVEYDDMPPSDAPQARLDADEKALLAAWIRAGAPLPEVATDDAPAPDDGRAPASESPGTLELVGRFHPLLVHFPIALLLAAVPALLLARRRRDGPWSVVALYCTGLGAAGAVLAAAVGWCAHEAGAGALKPDLVERHEWAGFATAFLAVAAFVAGRAAARGAPLGRAYPWLLLATAAVVGLAGHWGGALVWGEDYLPLPVPF